MATAPVTLPTARKGYYLGPNEVAISVEAYLRSTYRPDVDYVDGHIEERNVGEFDHSMLQRALMKVFLEQETAWGVWALPECRLQVTSTRFRVPDLMIISRASRPERVVREAPLLCIEVLSPEDNHKRILSRVDDYVQMGVTDIWVLDPEDGRVFTHASGERRWVQTRVLTVEGTPIRVDLDQLATYLVE